MKLPSRSRDFAPSEEPQDRQIRVFESEVGEINEARVPFHLRSTMWMLVAMFVLLAIVSIVSHVDRVVTSVYGQIVVTSPTIAIQTLDAGIVKSIDVKEGDRVKAGQLLAELDPTFAAADVDSLERQVSSLEAEIARCEAELAKTDFDFAPGASPGAEQYAALQKAYFVQRKAQYDSQVHAFDEQVAQANATITRLENDRQRYGDREKLIEELQSMRAQLVAKQLASRVDLLTATDQRMEMLRNLESVQNTILETRHQIQAILATRSAYIEQWNAATSQELVQARNSRDSAKSSLDKARKHQDVVRLTAPRDAIVLRLVGLSVGSIIQPSQLLMELAPLHIPMEGEIYISPADVGFVRPGDAAMVKLDAYDFAEHGWAEGKLRWISPGTFIVPNQATAGAAQAFGISTEGAPSPTSSQGSSAPFYKARVSIVTANLKNVPDDFELLPGMTLRADIHVGTRSIFWFLVRGLVRNFSESMRDP